MKFISQFKADNDMSEKYELNNGHIHEAIDRIHVTIEYIDNTLAKHPLIDSMTDFEAEIRAVIDSLANLYQKIASHDDIASISKSYNLKASYVIEDRPL